MIDHVQRIVFVAAVLDVSETRMHVRRGFDGCFEARGSFLRFVPQHLQHVLKGRDAFGRRLGNDLLSALGQRPFLPSSTFAFTAAHCLIPFDFG